MPNNKRNGTTRYGRHTSSEVSHQAGIAREFCDGCRSCVPQSDSFPGCKEGVVTSMMVPTGAITILDVIPQLDCLRHPNKER